jgi:predicted DNA-binding transcriptional regulator AlpA
MTAKTDHQLSAQALPADLASVALIDAPTCAAAGAMSLSWWHAEVAAGRAPAPVIQRPRCTRWRAAEVAAFWRAFGSQADASAADAVKARASKASAKARTPEAIAKAKATRAANIAAAHAKRRGLAAVPTQAGA